MQLVQKAIKIPQCNICNSLLPSRQGGWGRINTFSQSKWTEIHVRKKVQDTKAKVWITMFHSIWAMNRARPCCTRHLFFPHLLTSNTFLHLIPLHCCAATYISLHLLSFFSTSHFFELPLPLKFSDDSKQLQKKSSDTFLCISHYVKTGYDLSQDSTGAYRCVGKQVV